MGEKTLLVAAVAWSVVGLFVLLLLAAFTAPPVIRASDLENNVGKIVIAQGNISSIKYRENTVFLTLKDDSGELKAVFFGSPREEIFAGDFVAIKGKAKLYKGEPELVIEELRCFSC